MSYKLNIDRFRNDCGGFIDEDGCHYENEVDFYQTGVFGFCGCGNPKENLAFIRDGLRYVKNCMELERWVDDLAAWGKDYVNELVKQFFFYWANTAGLTEHGSMIP